MAKPQPPTIVVTGAARGIGAATAALASLDGWMVALLDSDSDAVQRQAKSLERDGGRCAALTCDVSDADQVEAAFKSVSQRLGPPSALVTAAGIDMGGRVEELALGEWDRVIAVNLRGTYLACREAVRGMIGHGGAIVCISSPFARVAAAGVGAYGASKAGVCSLVRSLAVDHARDGIRVNALLPGPTDTQLMWANVPPDGIARMRAAVHREVPLGRMAEPEEIARAALWLVSDSASYVTGAEIPCDGGVLAKASISV
jgi:NAD(P)-dependent dehydrogenase (short-subunit alcohol dehydrogenase family)